VVPSIQLSEKRQPRPEFSSPAATPNTADLGDLARTEFSSQLQPEQVAESPLYFKSRDLRQVESLQFYTRCRVLLNKPINYIYLVLLKVLLL
jgi:hypothetical protein